MRVAAKLTLELILSACTTNGLTQARVYVGHNYDKGSPAVWAHHLTPDQGRTTGPLEPGTVRKMEASGLQNKSRSGMRLCGPARASQTRQILDTSASAGETILGHIQG